VTPPLPGTPGAFPADRLSPCSVQKVVLESNPPAHRRVTSPDIYGESEVLVTGEVTGAKIG
jgi:hypothetical protein